MSSRLRSSVLIAVFSALAVLVAHHAVADEGMWVPSSLARDLPMDELKGMGLELSADEIWSSEKPSLEEAILQVVQIQPGGGVFGFGSASFVSSRGLVLTNHHVAFDAIAAVSTPERNYVKEGFRAKDLAAEIPCPNTGVRICTTFDDVTDRIVGDLPADADEARRQAQILERSRAVLEEAEGRGMRDVEIKAMLNGLRFYLVAWDTFQDVRLVYNPAQSVGEYGGDVDNWIWPRHTGDYTYLRVYVAPDGSRAPYSEDNVPYRPTRWLEVSTAGYEPGDFCFIMGFPGTTFRARTSYSVDYRERYIYPAQIEALKGRIADLEKAGENDPEARIANLSEIKSLANALKNFQGMVDGLAATGLVDRKREEEAAFQAWIEAEPRRRERWGALFPRLAALYRPLFEEHEIRDAVGSAMTDPVIGTVAAVASLAEDAAAPEGSRRITPERRGMLLGSIAGRLARMDLAAQRASLAGSLAAVAALPPEQRPAALRGVEDLGSWVRTALPAALDRDRVEKLAATPLEELAQGADPLVALGLELARLQNELNGHMAAFNRDIGELRRELTAARIAWQERAAYPDADSSLRFTYGTVRGYSPRDAVRYEHVTTPAGIVQKHTGRDPFDAPARLRELIERRDWGRWADPDLGVVPVNFLSDTDITGGNSGSAIMDGRGRLIGLAFDGNYEAMTSDYQFMPDITRTINVDIRYVLWCTEKLDGMGRLVEEMTLAD